MPTEYATTLNTLGQQREPFFFAIDFAKRQAIIHPLVSLPEKILYALPGQTPLQPFTCKSPQLYIKQWPSKERYEKAFASVMKCIKKGHTYMLNLTLPTQVILEGDLEAIFYASDAPYRCCIKDQWVCFSPECFIRIHNNQISTYPMKGTIDASIPDAKERILSDEKEMAEHVMVVDLLRNDLSMVSRAVKVEAFRYVERIHAGGKALLQVSSKITGELEETWHERIGDIVMTLLPAGSISGTPKRRSVEIIESVEGYERGFFTGVFGVYDGASLDSGVIIRFLERTREGYCFKSGGGITLLSDVTREYNELCDKVYLPVH